MREDMFKVIVERPRWGSRMKTYRGTKGGLDLDKMPKQQGMGRHRQSQPGWKELNENLKPLERYLGRQVGRPWNKVFSEICDKIDTRSTVKVHVRDHIEHLVALHIGISEDGTFYDRQHPDRNWRGKRWWQPLFVDPRNGLLKDSRVQWRKNSRRQDR